MRKRRRKRMARSEQPPTIGRNRQCITQRCFALRADRKPQGRGRKRDGPGTRRSIGRVDFREVTAREVRYINTGCIARHHPTGLARYIDGPLDCTGGQVDCRHAMRPRGRDESDRLARIDRDPPGIRGHRHAPLLDERSAIDAIRHDEPWLANRHEQSILERNDLRGRPRRRHRLPLGRARERQRHTMQGGVIFVGDVERIARERARNRGSFTHARRVRQRRLRCDRRRRRAADRHGRVSRRMRARLTAW